MSYTLHSNSRRGREENTRPLPLSLPLLLPLQRTGEREREGRMTDSRRAQSNLSKLSSSLPIYFLLSLRSLLPCLNLRAPFASPTILLDLFNPFSSRSSFSYIFSFFLFFPTLCPLVPRSTSFFRCTNMPSATLPNPEDKAAIKRAVPATNNKILTATVVRLFVAYPNPKVWSFTGMTGAIVFCQDRSRSQSYFFRLVDLAVRG